MEPILNGLGSFGLPGLMIAALLYAVKTLYERNVEIQEKRISEALATKDTLHDVAGALKEQTGAFDTLTDVIKQRGG